MMKALLPASKGNWRIADVPAPSLGPGQVLVRAAYVGLNNADVVALDAYDPADEPAVAGYEVAGTVVAVGKGVDAVRIGTAVMASTTHAFAQLVLSDSRHAIEVPESLGLEQAAALPTALLTEYGALRTGDFEAGQDVLILGATSAIGIVGVQLARALGARRVLATTRTGSKAERLREHGADVVIDTATGGLSDQVLEATDREGAHLVLDHVGGALFADALASTRRQGSLIQVGRLDRSESTIDLDTVAYRRLTVRGVSFGEADELADLLAGVTQDLLPLVAEGRVRPVVHGLLPLNGADEAAALVRDGGAQGKVVLSMP